MAQKWYILQVFSGHEQKSKERIESAAAQAKIGHLFEEMVIPSFQTNVKQHGKIHQRSKCIMPGYILAKMELCDETKNLIKEVSQNNPSSKISFLGGAHPKSISEDEAARAINQSASAAATASKREQQYAIGERVRVTEGPFANFNGVIEEIDFEKSKLKIAVSVFSRPTPIDLFFNQVEKED